MLLEALTRVPQASLRRPARSFGLVREVGNDRPGVGREPIWGYSLKGNHQQGMVFLGTIFWVFRYSLKGNHQQGIVLLGPFRFILSCPVVSWAQKLQARPPTLGMPEGQGEPGRGYFDKNHVGQRFLSKKEAGHEEV